MIEILLLSFVIGFGDVVCGSIIHDQRKRIRRLELQLEMLEHPERFPPRHPMCRATYWGRDLNKNPLPAARRLRS